MNQKPSIGRIVHYVLKDGQHRMARIVNAWPDSANSGICNLRVDLDPVNDCTIHAPTKLSCGLAVKPELCPPSAVGLIDGTLAAPSAPYDESGTQVGSWHWPERE